MVTVSDEILKDAIEIEFNCDRGGMDKLCLSMLG